MDQAKRTIPTPIQRATLCPRCGQPVIPSDNPEYRYQCLICDEDFYSFECTTVDDQAVSFPSREFVALLREYYHAGERVELISMNDPYHPPKPGEHGTVQCIDDAGNIHVSWDCGSGLSAIPGVDEIRKLEGAADNE